MGDDHVGPFLAHDIRAAGHDRNSRIRLDAGVFGKIDACGLEARDCTIERAVALTLPPPVTIRAFLPRVATTSPRREREPAPNTRGWGCNNQYSCPSPLWMYVGLCYPALTRGNPAVPADERVFSYRIEPTLPVVIDRSSFIFARSSERDVLPLVQKEERLLRLN